MDIKKHFEEQKKNWPNLEWHFLWMGIESTFPANQFFHESMWASWLKKIRAAEKADDAYLSQRRAEFEEYLNREAANERDFDPGELLADEAFEAFTLGNNIYAALVVSLWSKTELSLKRISSLVERQLAVKKGKGFDLTSQQKFFLKHLGITLSMVPSFSVINSVRILSNAYKHSSGEYCPKVLEIIPPVLADKWGVVLGKDINYTTLPIEEFVTHTNAFFGSLCNEARRQTEVRRK